MSLQCIEHCWSVKESLETDEDVDCCTQRLLEGTKELPMVLMVKMGSPAVAIDIMVIRRFLWWFILKPVLVYFS